MSNDTELLTRYAKEHSEAAFAQLVNRHLNLVYGVALRKLGGDAHLAQDVTQQVFMSLARKAEVLSHHPALTGWLFTSTHYASTQVVRAERRRRTREEKAETMNDFSRDTSQIDWERLRPMLDDLVQDLSERDRVAVVLRFYEGKTLAEVGTTLRLTEEGARSRVERALERMRTNLARRGVASTSAALAGALACQPALGAPAGLAAAVTGTALAAGAGGGIVSAVGIFMTMNKLTVGIASTLIMAGAAGFVVQAQTNSALRQDLVQLQLENQKIPTLQAENLRLTRTANEVDSMRADDKALALLNDDMDALKGRMQRAVQQTAQANTSNAVHSVKELDQPPRVKSQAKPVYPADLKAAGVSGDVVIDFVVDSTGKVHNAYAVSSSLREFEAPAVEAVGKWEFDPGVMGGRRVNTHLQVPIVFSAGTGDAAAGEMTPVGAGKL